MAERHISVWHVGKRAIAAFFADGMPTYAAALAYRVLFSIFPFLIFLTTLLGFLGIPEFFEWMRGQAAYVLPEQAMKLVNSVLGELQNITGPTFLTWLAGYVRLDSFFITVWAWAWIGASVAFGLYVQHFSAYNATYGSMGAVIMLLFFFLSAAVVLFGAELNATLARERGERVEEA